jgi:hypothetical protein
MPRKTIYLSDEIMPIIGCDEPGAFSRRLTGIVRDWDCMIKDAMPEFTENEWLFLMDMLNGVELEGLHAHNLEADVAECGTKDGLAEKWGVYSKSFARSIDALPLAGKIAIQDVAYRFRQPHGIVTEYREVLETCGARLPE